MPRQPDPRPVRHALVVATAHDRPTRQLLSAARKAEGLLREAGYGVVACYKDDATRDGVFSRLLGIRGEVHAGFLAAHGSTGGLHDRNRELLMDANVAKRFPACVLIIASCLHDGSFPRKTVANDSAKACIGYRGRLYAVPNAKFWSRLMSSSKHARALDDFDECTLAPLAGLLGKKLSAGRATSNAQALWEEKSRQYLADDVRINFVFRANARAIQCWGNRQARLG